MVSLVYVDKDIAMDPPLLGVFESGIPNAIAENQKLPFKLYHDENKNDTEILFAQTPLLHFVGAKIDSRRTALPLGGNRRYAVALIKPGKDAKIVKANGQFSIRQYSNMDAQSVDDNAITRAPYKQMRSEQIERFASKKRKREQRSNETEIFSTDPLLFNPLNQAIQDTSDKLAPQDENNINETYLPKHDANTNSPERIYKLHWILPKNLQDVLQLEQQYSILCDEITDHDSIKLYPKFVLQQGKKFIHPSNITQQQQPTLQQIRKPLSILVLMTYLLRLCRLSKHSINDITKQHQYILCSPILNTYFRDEFYTIKPITLQETTIDNDTKNNTSNNTSIQYRLIKQKIICYVMILALMISPNYTLDSNALRILAQDLHVLPIQLIPYLKQVGCQKATKHNAALVAPLVLPSRVFSRTNH